MSFLKVEQPPLKFNLPNKQDEDLNPQLPSGNLPGKLPKARFAPYVEKPKLGAKFTGLRIDSPAPDIVGCRNDCDTKTIPVNTVIHTVIPTKHYVSSDALKFRIDNMNTAMQDLVTYCNELEESNTELKCKVDELTH
jgi:hypothetical protein